MRHVGKVLSGQNIFYKETKKMFVSKQMNKKALGDTERRVGVVRDTVIMMS